MDDKITLLTREARSLYESGKWDEAIAVQQKLIADELRLGQPRAEHHMMLAMFYFECGKFLELLDWLEKASAMWPMNPEIAENLGVVFNRMNLWKNAKDQFERSLALGSTSTNVLDGLCHCLSELKEFGAAKRYGWRALEEKSRVSIAVGKKYPLPSYPPPHFKPNQKKANVISYSLWGNNQRYIVPLLQNLKLAPYLFPTWTIRAYVDDSVPEDVRTQMKQRGAEIVDKSNEREVPFYARLLWRFEVANDSTIERFLIRDADSLLTTKERVAVDAWLASDLYFHVMRDFFTHTDLMLAGMWGGVANVLPDMSNLWREYRSPQLHGRTADQRFLGDVVWPTVSQSCLIHDSVFTSCLGSVSFPPYGDLFPGHHIGQNAFAYFRRNR